MDFSQSQISTPTSQTIKINEAFHRKISALSQVNPSATDDISCDVKTLTQRSQMSTQSRQMNNL